MMVNPDYRWIGSSNPYTSDNPGNIGTGRRESDKHMGYCAQFDIYSAVEPVSPRDLY